MTTMNDLLNKSKKNVYAKILNKRGFIKALKELGANEDTIRKEWEKIETIFSIYYFEEAYSLLSKKRQDEVGKGLALTKDGDGMDEFIKRMGMLLTKDPKAIDQKKALQKAEERTKKRYAKHLEN